MQYIPETDRVVRFDARAVIHVWNNRADYISMLRRNQFVPISTHSHVDNPEINHAASRSFAVTGEPHQRSIMRTIDFLTDQEIFDRAVNHLLEQRRTALLPNGGAAYRGTCGGCPIGSFIQPADYSSAMEGVPVRYLRGSGTHWPSYMDTGVAALRRALLRARINVHDKRTVALLSCLQNVHDIFGVCEWPDRLVSIAREYGLSSECIFPESPGVPADGRNVRFAGKRRAPKKSERQTGDSPRHSSPVASPRQLQP